MEKGNMCTVAKLGCLLLVVGGLNWGLVGLGGFMDADYNVVNMLLGDWPRVEWVVYILVGLAAVQKLVSCGKGGCCGGMCKK